MYIVKTEVIITFKIDKQIKLKYKQINLLTNIYYHLDRRLKQKERPK